MILQHAVRDSPEGARPEELPGSHILLPPEGQPRLHAARPSAAAADVHGSGVGGVRVRSMLGFGAISPSLEQNRAVHDGAKGVRQTKRASRGEICARQNLPQSALDHESLERSGTAAAVVDLDSLTDSFALCFRLNADHP